MARRPSSQTPRPRASTVAGKVAAWPLAGPEVPSAPAGDGKPQSIRANDTGLDSANVTVATSTAIIKSVRRTFQILEFFERVERPATLTEIARTLNLPISSASMLMHSLSAMGYLNYNETSREFIPTMRVSLLGAWVQRFIFSDLDFGSLMTSMHERCGHTIMAGYLNGLYVQYIHVLQGVTPVRFYLAPGSSRLAIRSTLGIMLLSTMPERQIENVWTHSRLHLERDTSLALGWLKAEIGKARQSGFVYTTSLGTKGVGVIAAVLPTGGPHPAIALGIGGPAEAIAADLDDLVALILEHVGGER